MMRNKIGRGYGVAALTTCLLLGGAAAVPVALMVPGQVRAATTNLLGAFEDADGDKRPDGWNVYAKGNNCSMAVDDAVSHSGNKALVVDVTSANKNPVIVHRTVRLDDTMKDRKYSFSTFVKTESLKGGSAFCRYMLVDASNKAIDGSTEVRPKLTGDKDWTELKAEIEVPATLKGVDVAGIKFENYVGGNATGVVYFQDPTLEDVGSLNPAPAVTQGPLENADFEAAKPNGLPVSWGKWQSGSVPFECVVDAAESHGGASSVHIFNGDPQKAARGTLNQTIAPVPDEWQHKTVKVGQWVKTRGFDPQKLSLRMQWKDANGKRIDPYPTLPIKVAENQDWTYYEFLVDFPAQRVNSIVFEYLYDSCKGDVWVDDVTVDSYKKLADFSLAPDIMSVRPGETRALGLTFDPVDATNKTLDFASKDTAICTVDAAGSVTGVAPGVTSVRATSEETGQSREVCVFVGDAPVKTRSVTGLSTPEDTVLDASIEPDPIDGRGDVACVSRPSHGDVDILDGGAFRYYPAKGFWGADSFIIQLTDADGSVTLYSVSVDVTHTNPAPVFPGFKILVDQDSRDNTQALGAYDVEHEAITYQVAEAPQHGDLTIAGDSYVFTPEAGYSGYDSARVTAIDASGKSTDAEVLIYVAPSQAALGSLVKTAHPYMLVADKDDFARIRQTVASDPTAKRMYEDLRQKADAICGTAPVPHSLPDGLRMDTKASKNVVDLAFMYRMTGDRKYFNRCWEELHSLAVDYPDWNASKHFLDSNMTAFGVACAYDWLYDEMSDAQRDEVEDALVRNCIDPALTYFKNNSHFFINDGFNWNYVCNTGITSASLAIMGGSHDAKACEALQYSFKSIQNGLGQYAPEGDSIEGVSYWDYGTRYLVYLLSSISSATTGPNPFLSAPGISQTPDFPIAMTGKAGEFNYSDNDEGLLPAGYLSLWFARELGRPDLTWYHKLYMASPNPQTNVYDLLWYDPATYGGSAPKQLDWAFRDRQPVVTMRSDYADGATAFLGFKGGQNGAPHGDLDSGSFVFDAKGTRWVSDLGKGNYNLPGYWEKEAGGQRWNYYRKRAEGHNTLVLNPGTGYDQEVGAMSRFTELRINDTTSPYAVADLTEAYGSQAFSVRRGIRFVGRDSLLMRDEFNLKEPGTVAWQVHTTLPISVEAGGRKAVLTDGDRRLEIELVGTGQPTATFEVAEAKSYVNPVYPGEKDNSAFKKLIVRVQGKTGAIDVLMTPYEGPEKSCGKTPEILPLDRWTGTMEAADAEFIAARRPGPDPAPNPGPTTNPDPGPTTNPDSTPKPGPTPGPSGNPGSEQKPASGSQATADQPSSQPSDRPAGQPAGKLGAQAPAAVSASGSSPQRESAGAAASETSGPDGKATEAGPASSTKESPAKAAPAEAERGASWLPYAVAALAAALTFLLVFLTRRRSEKGER